MAFTDRAERSPGAKLAFAILVAALLAVPLFTVYLLVYDRESQSRTATASIAEGWGGPQTIAGPVLVIPYQTDATETVTEGGRQVTRVNRVWRELEIAPDVADLKSSLAPERRKRSIYEVVVYSARNEGSARFALPADLARYGVSADTLAYDRAELRFGLSDARGLYGPPPSVTVDGQTRALQPGKGPRETGGSGFFAPIDASAIRGRPLVTQFAFDFRGNGSLTLSPRAGDTRWRVTSPWQHPSFQGGFLPTGHSLTKDGFAASWRVGNLALGTALVGTNAPAEPSQARETYDVGNVAGDHQASVTLITPVDLYSQVNRSVKYGFLFIGFTFMAFLLFDVVGGVRVSAAEYLLVGAGLVLFFVMLLAFAEVIGFTPAYLLAAAMIIGLLTAYSAAVLKSRRRAGFIAGLLVALYAVLYVLLSLEAYSLLIGSLLLFAALASIMYLTRNLEWGARPGAPESAA
ncbi:cell envelope integrity protein CreD [Sphingomonas cannabina]|uniref:cell envelope integrity protein CreD n=1 Tax=Sphingomonas cannabina TaxID=2899123 RepID=UPI001EED232B|nr:cell envelope integrity protein CreD [Sphingomonas cannabina]UIJ45940.1 cell envelope integrity protein CreD [Sphingomonas cannabina]